MQPSDARIRRNPQHRGLARRPPARPPCRDELRPRLGPALPHVPADALRRLLRDQPVDGRRRRRSTASARSASGTRSSRRCARPAREIEVLEPQPGLPDLVFTANLGIVDGDTFIPARMRHPERRAEPAHAERWFREHGFAIRRLGEDVVQEGAGDALPFDGTLVGGYRTRSSASRLRRPRADRRRARSCPSSSPTRASTTSTSSSARSTRARALVAPDKLDAESARLSRELVPDPIALTDDEAAAFCANAVVVGRTVVMPACSPRLERELRARGFEPVVVDVSEFLKAGGGPRCLTLALDVRLGARATRPRSPSATPRTTTTRCRSRSRTPRAPGCTTTAAAATSTRCRPTRALNFGHRHPRLVAAARDAARPRDADEPRVLQRPARPVRARPRRADAARTACCR